MPAAKTSDPTAKTVRRPIRSPIVPPVNTRLARTSEYALVTQTRSALETWRSVWIDARFAKVAVMLKKTAITPTQIAIRLIHLPGMGASAASGG